MSAIVVLSTAGSPEQADLLARELVTRGLAACVNVVPGIRSTYRWQGKICQDGELLLVIKTLEGQFERVREAIRELHSYDLPEVIALPVRQGDPSYLEWIAAGASAPPGGDEGS